MPTATDLRAQETIAAIRDEVASMLPRTYEPLLLTFAVEATIREDGRSLVIGDDYGTILIFDILEGHIRSVDPSAELPVRFINSGIRQLAASIAAFEAVSVEASDGISDAALLRQAIAEIDPNAVSDPERWWAQILEQVERGHL